MNRDYSYCSGVTCEIRQSCKRYLPNPPDMVLLWVEPKYIKESKQCKNYVKTTKEEELTKWTLKKMSPSVPNKCESCDRFDECYTKSGRMREFCKMYEANVVFKFKSKSKEQ